MTHDDSQAERTEPPTLDWRDAAWQEPLIDLVMAFVTRRSLLALCVVVCTALAVLKLSRTESFYRATADVVLLPREKPALDLQVSASSMDVGEDRAQRADSGSLMLPANPDLYISLMTSRALLENLAEKLRLREGLSDPFRDDNRSDE
ncbi:MAG: hypothetical protein AAF533_10105, partial [Acidobacteriota bacterium]